MKIYIAADFEGISGICNGWQLEMDKPWHIEARHLLMGDINAAVQGVIDGGATEVMVWDNHSGGHNVIMEDLHEAADLVGGGPHNPRFPCLDNSFGGLLLIGYHAMSGTEAAVLDHTYDSQRIRSIAINGQQMGEVELDALWAGRLGVPVIMVSGDDKVCTEARRFLGGIEAAIVKLGIQREMAKVISPKRARRLIQDTAKQALKLVGVAKPFVINPPYEKRIVYTRSDYADGRTFDGKRIARADATTVVYRSSDLVDVLTMS
jgi:D-amino peptidase